MQIGNLRSEMSKRDRNATQPASGWVYEYSIYLFTRLLNYMKYAVGLFQVTLLVYAFTQVNIYPPFMLTKPPITWINE